MALTNSAALTATIYGARGSLPNPSAKTRRYGGATTCLGVETPDDIPIVIDGGSGIFDLGNALARRTERRELHMFFTHTHWDHLQRLPFFKPFYDAAWRIHIYSLGERRVSIREIFSGVYAERFFPVPFEQLAATIELHELPFEETVEVGNTRVTCCRVNHPGYALGFRIRHRDRSLFFASDAAPFTDMLFGDKFHVRKRDTDPNVLKKMSALQARVEATVQGSDLLFYDANYTDAEYEKLYHFGHSSMGQACDLAKRCGVPRLVLWHHDRGRTDEQLDAIAAGPIERGIADGVVVELARQGAIYRLPFGTDDIVLE